MKTIYLFKVISIVVLQAFLCSCNNEKIQKSKIATTKTEGVSHSQKGQAFVEDNVSNPNILQVALKSPDHTKLVAAVQAAQLENALVNAGPLMVFAPTNEAFEALPPDTFENLLKPENKEILATILKHHVTAGNYNVSLLKKVKKLGQADDTNVMVETRGDDIYVGGAKIIGSVKASNGTIYVVDKVILPL